MVLQTSISNHIHTIKDFHVLPKVVMVDPLQMDMVDLLQAVPNSHHNTPSSLNIHLLWDQMGPRLSDQMVTRLLVLMATQTNPQ